MSAVEAYLMLHKGTHNIGPLGPKKRQSKADRRKRGSATLFSCSRSKKTVGKVPTIFIYIFVTFALLTLKIVQFREDLHAAIW
jgi:hypothetical protein